MNVTATSPAGLVRAGAAHAAALAAIHAAAFAGPHRWSPDEFAALLCQPGVLALLDPAGGLVLARVAADEAEVLTLAVAPPVRRAGRARGLLCAAEQAAAGAGATTMFLEVAADNAPARALYGAAGYRQVGARPGYYPGGGDALVLARRLSPAAAAGG